MAISNGMVGGRFWSMGLRNMGGMADRGAMGRREQSWD